MLAKIYLGLLTASVAVMAFVSYYAWSWSKSIGRPEDALAGYDYHLDLSWTILWITTIVLLALGNSVLWTTLRSWAMWVTLAFFTVFIAVRILLLVPSMVTWNESAGIGSFGPAVLMIMTVFVVAAVIFFDQFIIIRLRQKTFAPAEAESEGEPQPDDIDLK